ncbi:uncharacterized protein QC763_710130 [Podospora pseudopauciseta]|uniref:Uncharacterized protein n=1 Tax=Podospora pseudopauciseta TaxID=2093780 RepID=A0ABR0H2B8_9PEZI|nr:hypothetical protein QC763_710130 [Podospora pseudopauciseta]
MSSIFRFSRHRGGGTPEPNGPKAVLQRIHEVFHPHHRHSSISFSQAEDTWADSQRRRLSITSTSDTTVNNSSRPGLAIRTGSFWRNDPLRSAAAADDDDDGKLAPPSHDRRRVAQEDGSFSLQQSRHTSKSDKQGGQSSGVDTRSSSTTDPFSPSELLTLSDTIRSSLPDSLLFPDPSEPTQQLISFLEWALTAETTPPHHPSHDHRIEFNTIQHAHLDKLLSEILLTGKSLLPPTTTPNWPLSQCIDLADSLQRAWRRRFKERYFRIDESRTRQLLTKGGLQGVCWSDDNPCPSGENSPSPVMPRQEQEKWRPRLEGRYNVYTLPLLSGREEDIGGHGNRSKYVRTGGLKEMHVKLITLVGKEVRVLRGYLLRSGIAPGVGVRFDGIWKLASYRHKLDLGTGEYKLELGLERVANGQRAMREVLKVPRPSQIDEWDLFEKLEADKVRQVQGEAASYAWRMQREEARVEREMWKRAHRFRESICSLGSGGSFVEGLGGVMRKRSEVVLMTVLPAPPGKVKGGGDEARKKVRMDSRASTVVYDVSTGEAWEEGEEEGVKRSSTRISWEDVLNDALEIAKGSVGEWGPGGGLCRCRRGVDCRDRL